MLRSCSTPRRLLLCCSGGSHFSSESRPRWRMIKALSAFSAIGGMQISNVVSDVLLAQMLAQAAS